MIDCLDKQQQIWSQQQQQQQQRQQPARLSPFESSSQVPLADQQHEQQLSNNMLVDINSPRNGLQQQQQQQQQMQLQQTQQVGNNELIGYYFGSISRDTAEWILRNHGNQQDGAYLLRSSGPQDNFVLSLMVVHQAPAASATSTTTGHHTVAVQQLSAINNSSSSKQVSVEVLHYKIVETEDSYVALHGQVGDEKFATIDELIEKAQGVATKPSWPILRQSLESQILPPTFWGLTVDQVRLAILIKAKQWGFPLSIFQQQQQPNTAQTWSSASTMSSTLTTANSLCRPAVDEDNSMTTPTPTPTPNATTTLNNETIRTLIYKSLHEFQPWFHGKISRDEAERRIESAGSSSSSGSNCNTTSGTLTTTNEYQHQQQNGGSRDGRFLVRERDNFSYAMCISHKRTTKHYRIDVLPTGELAIQDGRKFTSLMALVSHYTIMSDGLWCALTEACPRPIQSNTGYPTLNGPLQAQLNQHQHQSIGGGLANNNNSNIYCIPPPSLVRQLQPSSNSTTGINNHLKQLANSTTNGQSQVSASSAPADNSITMNGVHSSAQCTLSRKQQHHTTQAKAHHHHHHHHQHQSQQNEQPHQSAMICPPNQGTVMSIKAPIREWLHTINHKWSQLIANKTNQQHQSLNSFLFGSANPLNNHCRHNQRNHSHLREHRRRCHGDATKSATMDQRSNAGASSVACCPCSRHHHQTSQQQQQQQQLQHCQAVSAEVLARHGHALASPQQAKAGHIEQHKTTAATSLSKRRTASCKCCSITSQPGGGSTLPPTTNSTRSGAISMGGYSLDETLGQPVLHCNTTASVGRAPANDCNDAYGGQLVMGATKKALNSSTEVLLSCLPQNSGFMLDGQSFVGSPLFAVKLAPTQTLTALGTNLPPNANSIDGFATNRATATAAAAGVGGSGTGRTVGGGTVSNNVDQDSERLISPAQSIAADLDGQQNPYSLNNADIYGSQTSTAIVNDQVLTSSSSSSGNNNRVHLHLQQLKQRSEQRHLNHHHHQQQPQQPQQPLKQSRPVQQQMHLQSYGATGMNGSGQLAAADTNRANNIGNHKQSQPSQANIARQPPIQAHPQMIMAQQQVMQQQQQQHHFQQQQQQQSKYNANVQHAGPILCGQHAGPAYRYTNCAGEANAFNPCLHSRTLSDGGGGALNPVGAPRAADDLQLMTSSTQLAGPAALSKFVQFQDGRCLRTYRDTKSIQMAYMLSRQQEASLMGSGINATQQQQTLRRKQVPGAINQQQQQQQLQMQQRNQSNGAALAPAPLSSQLDQLFHTNQARLTDSLSMASQHQEPLLMQDCRPEASMANMRAGGNGSAAGSAHQPMHLNGAQQIDPFESLIDCDFKCDTKLIKSSSCDTLCGGGADECIENFKTNSELLMSQLQSCWSSGGATNGCDCSAGNDSNPVTLAASHILSPTIVGPTSLGQDEQQGQNYSDNLNLALIAAQHQQHQQQPGQQNGSYHLTATGGCDDNLSSVLAAVGASAANGEQFDSIKKKHDLDELTTSIIAELSAGLQAQAESMNRRSGLFNAPAATTNATTAPTATTTSIAPSQQYPKQSYTTNNSSNSHHMAQQDALGNKSNNNNNNADANGNSNGTGHNDDTGTENNKPKSAPIETNPRELVDEFDTLVANNGSKRQN